MVKLTIEESDEGFIVYGAIPLEDSTELIEKAKKKGFDRLDAGVSQAIGATMVITNIEGSKKLREDIEKKNAGKSREDQWLFGADTGLSSRTIFGVMTNRPVGKGHHPYDPDDFGRCYRLLKLFPEWLPRMHEVAEKYPRGWTGLVAVWDQLTKLYESEKWHELYEKMETAYKE